MKADSSNYAKVLAPIYGLADSEPVTLSGALQQVCKLCAERDLAYPAKKFKVLSASVWAANSFVQSKWDKLLLNRYGSRGMTKDLAAFLNFYCQESPFYPEINRLLRDEVRGHLVPYFSWLRGFLSACYCLPLQPDNVLRGVKKNLKSDFSKGQQVVWWSITSTTRDIGVLQSAQFLGSKGARTMFTIRARSLVNIRDFSMCPEEELILLPGTILKVKNRKTITMKIKKKSTEKKCANINISLSNVCYLLPFIRWWEFLTQETTSPSCRWRRTAPSSL